jgi:hypothetical protein
MQRHALNAYKVMELLTKHGYICPPEKHAEPTIEEDSDALWIDINALAVRQGPEGDEVPDYPIRLLFQKVKTNDWYEDLALVYVRELTAEEAKTSKAMSRQPDERKKFGAWAKPTK